MVALRPVDESNWRAALQLSVLPEQQRFVAGITPIAAIVLAKAYVRPGGLNWLPFAIFVNEQIVGLLELALHTGWQRDLWLFHFFIDHRYQGRGHGKAAMQALVRWIEQYEAKIPGILLTVHPENHAAQRLYASVGFEPTGEIRDDEPVFRLALS